MRQIDKQTIEAVASETKPLHKLPATGYYGGKPTRITIKYDDNSGRCIGNADGNVDNIFLAQSGEQPDSDISEVIKRMRLQAKSIRRAKNWASDSIASDFEMAARYLESAIQTLIDMGWRPAGKRGEAK